MKLSNALKTGAIVAAAGALAFGGATAAHAAVTTGHVDAVSIGASNIIGSKFGSTQASWPLTGGQDLFVFSGGGVSCSGGVYSISAFPATAPSVGFNNNTGNSAHTIGISAITSGQSVTFDGPGAWDLNTSGLTQSLNAGGHLHGSWKLTSGTTCVTGGVDFPVKFEATEASPGTGYDDQTITFRVVI